MSELPQLPEPEIRSPDGIGFSYAQVRVIQAVARAQGRDEMREWKTARVRAEGFAAGWRTAANWMERDDLIADIGSPAYIKDRDEAIGTPKSAEGEGNG